MNHLEKQLKDFAQGGLNLVWQRQFMYVGATALTGYFYNFPIAISCYLFALATEVLDYVISKRVTQWDGKSSKTAARFLHLLTISSTLSALAVVIFVILVAREEGNSVHFTSLFFLFSAALFAAMNNHQLLRVLIARLIIYSLTFIYIPAHDLWVVRPPLDSYLWLQLMTVVFVLYFIVDCSMIFLKLYRKNLSQMTDLELERDRAENAYKMQSQFVSIVSHELRTPLTSIKGSLGLIKSGGLGETTPKIDSVVAIAYKNSNRLAVLIDDLLDVQKFESGKMNFKLKPVDLAQLIQEAAEANESLGSTMDVTFKTFGLEKPVFVNADHDRMMQVMANILSNAVKFSKHGGLVEITLKEQNDKACIYVKDYGEGIPESSKDLVFGQFTQVDSTIQRKTGGTGLGMYITKNILDGHNGTIDFTSVLGEGTTFIIELDKIPG